MSASPSNEEKQLPWWGDVGQSQELSSQQAHEAAYRFVARYYDYERIAPLLRMLQDIAWRHDDPDSNREAWASWQVCVQETLDGAPLPDVPPPWA
jgi:hypothetical protein